MELPLSVRLAAEEAAKKRSDIGGRPGAWCHLQQLGEPAPPAAGREQPPGLVQLALLAP
jgi:hypothetical protein